jgi:hypothetical protein
MQSDANRQVSWISVDQLSADIKKSLPQICGRDFCFTESVVSFSFLFLSSFRGLLMLLVRMEVTIDIAHS